MAELKKGLEGTNMQLPESIRQMIADEAYQTDDIGMSHSFVLIFEDKVLKIQERGREAENEQRMMSWLRGRLPVPRVLAYETAGDMSYLLMSRVPGEMACGEAYMRNPARQTRLLATGLKRLWSVDISGCPADWSLKNKLAQARYNVENGLVDMDNVEPDTFGEHGFQSPAALLRWLYENQPREELVLSHGDYCLPNILGAGEELCGYIDLGRMGAADRWCDIALCYRSLSHNYSGKYHSRQAYAGYDDMLLFRELGLEPDWEKIRYYILLDELF